MRNAPPPSDPRWDAVFPTKIRPLITYKFDFEGHKPEVLRPILTAYYHKTQDKQTKKTDTLETKHTRNMKTRCGKNHITGRDNLFEVLHHHPTILCQSHGNKNNSRKNSECVAQLHNCRY